MPNNYIFLDENKEAQNVKNRCLFEILNNNGFTLQSSFCKSRNILITYLKHKPGENGTQKKEEFEKCIKGQVDGSYSTSSRKWKESNHCLTRFLIKK